MSTARVSIGMPVYNGEADLAAVLDALLGQTFTDFELVISDNASTDGTEAICRDRAAHDPRIRYIRQASNLGAPHNFQFVLDQSRGEYYMWAACDDKRSPDFLAVNVEFLDAHPDYVASTSPVRFDTGDFDTWKMGDAPLDGPLAQRLAGMFGTVHANGRFYSLMRRSVVADCPFVQAPFLGSDWAVVLHLANHGKLQRTDRGWVELGTAGISSSVDIFARCRRDWLDLLLPFRSVAAVAWRFARDVPARGKLQLAWGLAVMNAKGFVGQFVTAWRRRARSN